MHGATKKIKKNNNNWKLIFVFLSFRCKSWIRGKNEIFVAKDCCTRLITVPGLLLYLAYCCTWFVTLDIVQWSLKIAQHKV